MLIPILVSLSLVQLSDQLAAALPDEEAHRPVEDLNQLLVVQVRPVVLAHHAVPGTTQRHVQLGLDKPAILFSPHFRSYVQPKTILLSCKNIVCGW